MKEDFSVIKENFRNIRKITMTSLFLSHNKSNLEIVSNTYH